MLVSFIADKLHLDTYMLIKYSENSSTEMPKIGLRSFGNHYITLSSSRL